MGLYKTKVSVGQKKKINTAKRQPKECEKLFADYHVLKD